MIDCLLQGVSGMWALGRPAFGSLMFLFFFEINPVDMKAAGSGLADLYVPGVANEPWDEFSDESREGVGLVDPIGKDFEKSWDAGLVGRWNGS